MVESRNKPISDLQRMNPKQKTVSNLIHGVAYMQGKIILELDKLSSSSLLIVKTPGGVCNITQINNQTHKQYVAANQQSQTIQSLSIIINCLPYED